MVLSFKKILVITLLVFTSLFQGWPLLVAATCSMMSGPQMTNQMKGCCCCDGRQRPASASYSACNPGQTLVGVLDTDPSLLPAKDHTAKFWPASFIVTANLAFVSATAPSSAPGVPADHSFPLPAASPPLYLVDCTLRI